MVKIPAARVDSFVRRPDPAVRLVLIYGADVGMVRERANLMTRGVVEDPSDPFRVVEIEASALASDPARLADEAAAITFGGGQRVIRVTGASDSLGKLIKSYLDDPIGDALILIESGMLPARSSLRKIAESNPLAAALPCYADEGRALGNVIRTHMQEAGMTISDDAVAFLTDHLGSDRQVTRQELNKLVIFCSDPDRESTTPIRREDAAAVVGDSAALDLDALVNAAADGRLDVTDRILARLASEDTAAITIIRAANRHMGRIDMMNRLLAAGKPVDQAARSLQPPAFGPRATALGRQGRCWNNAMLDRAYQRLNDAEIQCKSTGMPDQTIAQRALMALAMEAARAARR